MTRIVALGLAGLVTITGAASAAKVNVYTYREQPLIQPIFDLFTKETGTKVNVIYSNKGLEERMKAESAARHAVSVGSAANMRAAALRHRRDVAICSAGVIAFRASRCPARFVL